VEFPPVQRARRRDKDSWPTWKVTTRCLDCAFTSTVTQRAANLHDAKMFVRATLPPPTKDHRHRYASAAGPA
jgi:hypothetical protein